MIYSLLLLPLRSLSRLILFPGCSVALPAPGATSGHAPSSVEVVDYPTADGLTLRGAWVRAKPPGVLTALYFHGNAESARTSLGLAQDLARAGVDVFLAEYRGYGGLAGSPSEENCYLDAAAALAVVRAAKVDDERLVIIGRSIGTGVAVELASQGHGCQLLLVSPYTSIVDIGWRRVGPLAPLLIRDRFDSLSKIKNVKSPITVFHGTNDGVIPFDLGQRLAAAAGAKFVPVEGAGHNDIPFEQLLSDALRPLVLSRLRPPAR